jgi:hypothetical protein
MPIQRHARVPLLAIAGLLAAAAASAPTASADTVRYASPDGTGSDCSSASPCSLTSAIKNASFGDDITVTPGDYPLTETLSTPGANTIRGVPGQPRPRLLFGGLSQDGLRLLGASTLRYVEVDQLPGTESTAIHAADFSKVDQVIARASGAGRTASIVNSTIMNSIVVASGAGGRAIETYVASVSGTGTYRNVTAIATGSGGVAIKAIAESSTGNAQIYASNVIARGGSAPGTSLAAVTDSSGAHATITTDHSNYATEWVGGSNAKVTSASGFQNSLPLFAAPVDGDYHEADGSATIGAGLDDPMSGTVDVDGDPRKIGTTDIGADEFVPAPAALTGPASAVAERSATLGGNVTPKGAPTSYRFEWGTTSAYGASSPETGAGSGTAAAAAAATIEGLSPGTTYHYRIVASNSGGVTAGGDQTFTTLAATTAVPPPAQAFAGVKLVSSRLALAGRSIPVTLSCPAAASGRCSGRMKLTARRHRPSSRVADTVTLGRAAFLIPAGKRARLRLRISRAGQRLFARASRLRGRAVSAAYSGTGESKTTVTAVTIRRRR